MCIDKRPKILPVFLFCITDQSYPYFIFLQVIISAFCVNKSDLPMLAKVRNITQIAYTYIP